jgi:hypothetical protein
VWDGGGSSSSSTTTTTTTAQSKGMSQSSSKGMSQSSSKGMSQSSSTDAWNCPSCTCTNEATQRRCIACVEARVSITQVSAAKCNKYMQIYSNTDWCLITFYTWLPTTRSSYQ